MEIMSKKILLGDVGRKLCENSHVSRADLSGHADRSAPNLRILMGGIRKKPGKQPTMVRVPLRCLKRLPSEKEVKTKMLMTYIAVSRNGVV